MAMNKVEKKAFDTMRNACALLVLAYNRGKQHGGSVDWSDVDNAWELAKRGLQEAKATVKPTTRARR